MTDASVGIDTTHSTEMGQSRRVHDVRAESGLLPTPDVLPRRSETTRWAKTGSRQMDSVREVPECLKQFKKMASKLSSS